MRANRKLLITVALLWTVTLITGEILSFEFAALRCEERVTAARLAARGPLPPTVVALIADPQITDEKSYASFPRGSWLLRAVEHYCDRFMRRSFVTLERYLRPDAIVMAGDMIDNTRYVDEASYQRSLTRFEAIFQQTATDGMRGLPPRFNVSGNHDIGWGERNAARQRAYVRQFERHFGPVNSRARMGGFEWVFLASCLATGGPTSDAKLHEQTSEFLDMLARTRDSRDALPRILVTHIPLYRTGDVGCGPLRGDQKRLLRAGAGLDYINMLPKECAVSAVQPVAVFSGDDHDVCVVQHELKLSDELTLSIPETTLGTFSWLQGSPQPSYGIVVLDDRPRHATLHTEICFLPSQIAVFRAYIGVGALTLLAILLFARTTAATTSLYHLLRRERGSLTLDSLLSHMRSVLQLLAVIICALLLIYAAMFY